MDFDVICIVIQIIVGPKQYLLSTDVYIAKDLWAVISKNQGSYLQMCLSVKSGNILASGGLTVSLGCHLLAHVPPCNLCKMPGFNSPKGIVVGS